MSILAYAAIGLALAAAIGPVVYLLAQDTVWRLRHRGQQRGRGGAIDLHRRRR